MTAYPKENHAPNGRKTDNLGAGDRKKFPKKNLGTLLKLSDTAQVFVDRTGQLNMVDSYGEKKQIAGCVECFLFNSVIICQEVIKTR